MKHIAFITVLIFLFNFGKICEANQLVLKNNGYEGLIVIIKDSVPENGFNKIESIKLRFTEASKFLFKATERRAYFRKITIVVPRNWENVGSVEKISSINVFSEHIRVEPTNEIFPSPYVRGNMKCGKPGWYMRLDPRWLNRSLTTDGNHAKVLIHEWGHLRWGLFDEYASVNRKDWRSPGSKIYFDAIDKEGNAKPVGCTVGVQGAPKRDCNSQDVCTTKDALEDSDCKFCPKIDQPTIRASLMSYQYISGVEHFCDQDIESTPLYLRHDSTSRNKQNEFCDGQSSWEVMRQHEDFRNDNNPSLPENQTVDTTPTFEIVQEGGRTRVFVFDVSGSMAGEKIAEQKVAADLAIDAVIEVGSCLGVVTFSNSAYVRASMTYVDGTQTKTKLKQIIPTSAGGGTKIYLGLVEAIGVIESARQPCNNNPKGAEIILLSDGASSTPYLDQISPQLVEKGIIVHTIAITDTADSNMAELASRTGGRSYTYLETQTVSFADTFGQALATNDISSLSPEKILSENQNLASTSRVNGTFNLEEGLGNNTIVTVEINKDVTAYLTLTDPEGKTFKVSNTGRRLVIEIPGTAKVGVYSYTIESIYQVQAFVKVFSQPVSVEASIVRVTSHLSSDKLDFFDPEEIKLYVELVKGHKPLLNANVTAVLAATSRYRPIHLVLRDNGIGADTQNSDGIYSVYLIKRFFKVKTRYIIKVTVTNSDDSIIYTENIGLGGGRAALLPNVLSRMRYTPVKVHDFQRQSIPPSIRVENFSPNFRDSTPPAKISDLDIANRWEEKVGGDTANNSITFNLVWTAVGNDMDIGQASEYDLRMDGNITALRKEYTKSTPVNVNLSTPLEAGQRESVNVTLYLSNHNRTIYLAIRARDNASLWGEVSNILPLDVIFLSTPPYTTPTSDLTDGDSKVLPIAVGSSVAGVLVIVIIVGLMLWSRRRR